MKYCLSSLLECQHQTGRVFPLFTLFSQGKMGSQRSNLPPGWSPNDVCPLVFTPLYNPLPQWTELASTWPIAYWWERVAFKVALRITCSGVCQSVCHEDTLAGWWIVPEGEELRSPAISQHQLASHMSESFWKEISPHPKPSESCSPSCHLTSSLWKTLSQNFSSKLLLNSWFTETLRDNKYLLLLEVLNHLYNLFHNHNQHSRYCYPFLNPRVILQKGKKYLSLRFIENVPHWARS